MGFTHNDESWCSEEENSGHCLNEDCIVLHLVVNEDQGRGGHSDTDVVYSGCSSSSVLLISLVTPGVLEEAGLHRSVTQPKSPLNLG